MTPLYQAERSGAHAPRPAVAPALAGVRAVQYPISAWPSIAPVWSRLAGEPGQHSFFLSPVWVETWLEVFGRRLEVSILLFESASDPVGVCLLVNTKPRPAWFPLHRISLNTSGEDVADTVYIEFNGLLCRAGWEEAVAASLTDFLLLQPWDEFALDGFCGGRTYDALKKGFAGLEVREDWKPSYRVDLDALRRSGISYEASLSGHRRKSLRQGIRAYSAWGPLRLDAAGDLNTALEMFEELAGFNNQRRLAHGRHSVFESLYFVAFHRALIRRCFPESSVQLLRLAAGPHTIGLLYNLVHAGTIYFYQCGFNYGLDKRLSPGMITLAHAIQYGSDRGFDNWDFLAGDADYKRLLSTGSRDLVWAVFRRANMNTVMVDAARAAKRFCNRMLAEKLAAK